MAHFGESLFSGSKFIFWVLAPCLLGFAATLPFIVEIDSVIRFGAVLVCGLTSVLVVLSLWPYRQLLWPKRLLCALIFLAYLVYPAEQWFLPNLLGRDGSPTRRFESLAGLLVIGYPCLVYALTGQFRPRRRPWPDAV